MSDQSPLTPKCTQIIQAARKLFLESGYEATSMDALAREADVSKRTVYSYFENKKALFGAIMEAMCNESGCIYPAELSPDIPPEQALKEFARNMVGLEQSPEEKNIFRIVLAEGIKFPELGETFWNNGPEPAKRILSAYLSEQTKRNILEISDPNLAAMQFIGMVKWPHSMPELFGIKASKDADERNRALDQAISIFLAGTRSPS